MINQDTILHSEDIPLELLIVLGVNPAIPKISNKDKERYIKEFPSLWYDCGGKEDVGSAMIRSLERIKNKKRKNNL